MILSCSNICKSFGSDDIIKNASFHIEDHEKAAIVGINGAGKSTLLKIIVGELAPDSGEVVLGSGKTLGYLAQNQDLLSHRTIYEEMLDAKKSVIAMENRLRDLENSMKTASGEELETMMNQYSRLSHEFELINDYAWKSEIVGVLKGLGFTEEEFSKQISTLSGGQKTRVSLGKLLLTNPDIILLDLNIPKVSGLEILEFLKKEEMPTKVIVVSCQEEFDVVKKAMKLGAYDYLRKLNLSSNELENILEKCLGETEERITVHMQGIREIRYEEIVRDSRDILAGACNYQTLICILAKDTEELSRVTEIIHKWAETELREGLQIQKGNQYGYFLLEDKPEKSVYMELKKRAERKTGRELYMGIFEGCMEKTADIVRAAAMAEQIQLFSYYDKEEKLVFFQKKIETEGHSPRGMHGYLDSLKEKIRSFDREKTEQELHGIFGLIRQESYISINVLRRNFMDILGIYSMVAQSLNGALEEIELDGDNCHYQKIMMMESLREIEKWFLKFNDIFMEKFWIAYKCSRSEILQKVVKYIEAHITEPIHLSDAAAETGVSSAYLSTMFKKEIGYNFIEYVNLRKIELARQMLQDGKMVYEVSELLGFENSTYFSRVFKRYTDVSPDTYRKQM